MPRPPKTKEKLIEDIVTKQLSVWDIDKIEEAWTRVSLGLDRPLNAWSLAELQAEWELWWRD